MTAAVPCYFLALRFAFFAVFFLAARFFAAMWFPLRRAVWSPARRGGGPPTLWSGEIIADLARDLRSHAARITRKTSCGRFVDSLALSSSRCVATLESQRSSSSLPATLQCCCGYPCAGCWHARVRLGRAYCHRSSVRSMEQTASMPRTLTAVVQRQTSASWVSRSILMAMIKSFSWRPFIFLVRNATVA